MALLAETINDPSIDKIISNENELLLYEANPYNFINDLRRNTKVYLIKVLYLLKNANPWMKISEKDCKELYLNFLFPLMDDRDASEKQHALVAYNLHMYIYRVKDDKDLLNELMKKFHIMIEERRTEMIFYLEILNNERLYALQDHLGTHSKLLEMLEGRDIRGIISCNCRNSQMKMEIIIKSLVYYSFDGRLAASLSESDQMRLLEFLELVYYKHNEEYEMYYKGCIVSIIATLNEREIWKIFRNGFLDYIKKDMHKISKDRLDIFEVYYSLLEKLTSPELLFTIVSTELVKTLICSWKESNYSFKNEGSKWCVMVNVTDWVLDESHEQYSELISVVKYRMSLLQSIQKDWWYMSGTNEFEKAKIDKACSKLLIKFEQPMMNLNYIFFCQDSIGKEFYNGKSVRATQEDLLDRKLSPHKIPSIEVFFYKGEVVTKDNRRLYAFKNACCKRFPVIITSDVPEKKFTAKNNGRSIKIRG